MKKQIINTTIKVPLIGKPDDYINLPIVQNENAIGVITDCIEEDSEYKLTVTLWKKVRLELINGVPSAVVFD